MLINLTCFYCNYSWDKYLNSKKAVNDQHCLKCGDSNLRVVDLETSSIDYYKGSPPFDDKKSANDVDVLDYYDNLLGVD